MRGTPAAESGAGATPQAQETARCILKHTTHKMLEAAKVVAAFLQILKLEAGKLFATNSTLWSTPPPDSHAQPLQKLRREARGAVAALAASARLRLLVS